MMRIMNRKKFLLFTLLVALATAGQIIQASGEQFTPLLKVAVDDIYLTAGQENKMEISLRNTGDFDVYEVETFLSVPATTTGISILKGSHRVFNKIGDRSTSRLYPVIYVDSGTPLGAYTLTFQFNYNKIYKQGLLQSVSKTVQLGIVVTNVTKQRVDVDVSIDVPELVAGAEEEVTFVVENIGEEAMYSLDARITSPSPYVVILEDARFTSESLASENLTSFTPTLLVSRSAPLGVYTLTATVSYEDADGKEYEESLTLGVNVNSVQVKKQTSIILRGYTTDPEPIRPGDVVVLRLEVACTGAKAYEVKTSLAFAPGVGISPLSPTLVDLGDMDAGGVTDAAYSLIVDGGLEAGQYPGTLILSYLDADGVPRSLVESVTLRVRGIVAFSLINDDPVSVAAGAETELEADLLLIGTESVQFVEIEVEAAGVFRRVSGSGEYIGAVDPDSPIPFDVNFGVADDAEPGEHALRLAVGYTDDMNQEHEESLELPVTVSELSPDGDVAHGSTGGFWVWLRRLLGLGP